MVSHAAYMQTREDCWPVVLNAGPTKCPTGELLKGYGKAAVDTCMVLQCIGHMYTVSDVADVIFIYGDILIYDPYCTSDTLSSEEKMIFCQHPIPVKLIKAACIRWVSMAKNAGAPNGKVIADACVDRDPDRHEEVEDQL